MYWPKTKHLICYRQWWMRMGDVPVECYGNCIEQLLLWLTVQMVVVDVVKPEEQHQTQVTPNCGPPV